MHIFLEKVLINPDKLSVISVNTMYELNFQNNKTLENKNDNSIYTKKIVAKFNGKG